MNIETWKGVKGFESLYEVSDLGRVRSLGRVCRSKNNSVQRKSGRVMVQEISIHGYCRVGLKDATGKNHHKAVHRLVAESFIRDLKDGEQVNHINEIKTDNRLVNLEICDAKYNCNYGTRNEKLRDMAIRTARRKAVDQYTKDGVFVKRHDSVVWASRETGIYQTTISHCARGKRPSAGGYVWRWA